MGNVQNSGEKDEVQGLSQLHIAAERGDTEAVRSLLMSSANVDVMDIEHNTPLHFATQKGHVDVVNLLLSKNAGVNSKNDLGQTSLHLASKHGHLAAVQVLLLRNADVNAVCKSQSTPLHVAAESGHADIVQNLIINGANVNACNSAKMTALQLAYENGHAFVADILLENHATVDVKAQFKETIFNLAAENGHAGVSDLLLQYHVCEKTPLRVAVKKVDDDEDVSAHYETGNEGNIQKIRGKDQGLSQLHQAAKLGNTKTIRNLLKLLPANVDVRDIEDNTPLHYAAEEGHVDVVDLLLSYNASVNSKNASGQTSLHLASKHGHTGVAQILSKCNACIHVTDQSSNTLDLLLFLGLPLMLGPVAFPLLGLRLGLMSSVARRQVFVDIATKPANRLNNGANECLQGCNKNVDATTLDGNTALQLASASDNFEVVNILLGSNADVNIYNSSGKTSLHFAAEMGFAGIVKALIDHKAEANACNKDKMTALHLACENGHTSIVKILLDNHAIVDIMKQSKETPFYLAAKNGHADVTDLLLRRGVSDFVLKDDKETPLHVAVKNGHTEVVEVILKHIGRISGKLKIDGQKAQENVSKVTETKGIQPIKLFRSNGRCVTAGLVCTEENKPLEIRRDSDGYTVFDLAVLSNKPKLVQLLLNADQCWLTYSEGHLRRSFDCLIMSIGRYQVSDCRNYKGAKKVLSDNEQHEKFCKNLKQIAQTLTNSRKFDVNHRDVDGQTPLHEVMKVVDPLNSEKDKTLLMIDLMQLLLEKGADFNSKNSVGRTPLIIACEKGCCYAVRTLLDWEFNSGIELDIYARDRYGTTALIKAAERSHVSVIRLLLKRKASVNLCDYCGFTPLHAAIYESHINYWFDFCFFYKGLLDRNFDGVNSLGTNSRGKPRLRGERVNSRQLIDWLQCRFQFIEGTMLPIIEEELDQTGRESADLHAVFNRQLSNLRHSLEAVKVLLDNDETNVNALDYRGNMPLDLAMESFKVINSVSLKAPRNCGAIQRFHEAPLEVTGVDNRGRNPLHRLIISSISDCLFEYLTSENERKQEEDQYDFMVNRIILLSPQNFKELASATDNKGRTPLHYAAMSPSSKQSHKHGEAIKMLLEIGSKVNAVDIYGKIPLHYAEDKRLYKLLDYYGANTNAKDQFGNTPKELRQLRKLVTLNDENARNRPHLDLYLFTDIAKVLNTNHVTGLIKRKRVDTIRIYSQSPSPRESSEEAIWRMWKENEFIHLNRRLSHLKPSVKHFIQRLADGIKKKDWRFECQPILVGSADEETKAVLSADFDFDFRLIKFSQFCDPFPHPLGPRGYFELKKKTNEDKESRIDEMFDCFFDVAHCLLTDKVNSRFKIILEDVLGDPDFWQSEHLFDWNMKHKYSSRYVNNSGLHTNIRLRLLNPIEDGEGGSIFVKISIDIVACVHLYDWWPEDPLPIGIDPYAKMGGCTFIFDRPRLGVCEPRGTHFISFDTFARITFALESRTIRESSLLMKAAYMVCKLMFHRQFKTTHQLKTCLLYCMEAHNIINGSRPKARNEDEITPKQLAFWVERLVFCFMEFSRLGIYPCYFMPTFRRNAFGLKLMAASHQCLKRKDDKDSCLSENLNDFSYCAVFGLYLDLCPGGSVFDIPIETQVEHRLDDRSTRLANGYPILKQFNREEFIKVLASRSSNSQWHRVSSAFSGVFQNVIFH